MSFFNHIKPYFRSAIRSIYFFIKKYPAQHIIASIVIIMHFIPFAFRCTSKMPKSNVSQKLQVFTYISPTPSRVNTQKQSTIKGQKKISRPKISAMASKGISKNAIHSVEKICNKLKQIEQNTSTKSSTLLLPELPKECIDETESVLLSYQTILLEYLEKNILLPEQGTVDLQITLSDNGKPISIKIIHSTSKINADFLCTELEKHTFPSFIKNTKEKTFILSFQSHVI
ncbi:MAG: hypothetical protein ACRCSV_05745 [Chlamydiales bacterium]